jgi:hypothetical protein
MAIILSIGTFAYMLAGLSNMVQQTDPKASISGKNNGEISVAEIIKAERLQPNQPDLKIVIFSFSFETDDDVIEILCNSDVISPEIIEQLKKLKTGSKISFENIKAKHTSGNTIIMEALVFIIK